MTLIFESSAKIKALRSATGMNQVAFAKALGVARSLIAACESGSGNRAPSTDLLVKLGNVAAENQRYTDAEWFWRKAGVTLMIPTALELLKQIEAPTTRGLMTSLHANAITAQDQDKGRFLLFPSQLLPNPLASSYAIVADDALRPMFNKGDVLIVDESETNPWKMVGRYIATLRHTAWERNVRALRQQLSDEEYARFLPSRPERLGLFVGWLHPTSRDSDTVLEIEAPNSLGGISRQAIAFETKPIPGGSTTRKITSPEFAVLGRVIAWIDASGKALFYRHSEKRADNRGKKK